MLNGFAVFVGKLFAPVLHWFKLDTVPFFDPDTQLFATDKAEHFIGVALLTFALTPFFPNVTAGIVAVIAAATFELGQWDVLRSAAPHLIGEPGYGFGLLDLVVGAAGAGAVVLGLFVKHLL